MLLLLIKSKPAGLEEKWVVLWTLPGAENIREPDITERALELQQNINLCKKEESKEIY